MKPELGEYLRSLRTARELSMNQLARRAGTLHSTLSRWESGQCQPRLPELEAVLAALAATSAQRQRALTLLSAPRAVQRLRQEASVTGAWQVLPPPSAGGLLRAMRLRQKRTLQEVARQIGVQQSTLTRWERGETWPDAEKLHDLCYALRAQEAEVVALTCGPGLAPAGLEETGASMDSLEAHLEKLVILPALHPADALKDLLFLRLEARVWPLLTQPRYVRFLRSVFAHHANYLSGTHRYREAFPYADFALEQAERDQSRTWWMYAAIVQAQCEAYCGRRPAPQRGLEALHIWQPYIQHPAFAAWVWKEQAEYTFLTGERERALALSAEACQIAEHAANATEYAVRLRDRAHLLVQAKQPQEALALLDETAEHQEDEPLPRTVVALLRAEAFALLNQKRQARKELCAASDLIRAYNIERLQERAETIALQCSE